MKPTLIASLLLSFAVTAPILHAQKAGPDARAGQNFIPTRVFTLEQDQEIL